MRSSASLLSLRNVCSVTLEHLESRTLLAASDLDPTFGTAGIVRPDATSRSAVVAAQQADGKIVVAGESAPYFDRGVGITIARYKTDGSVDSTFGSGGSVNLDLTPLG